MKNHLEGFVNFKKRRNIGQTITDAIAFMRFEGTPFLSTIIRFSMIPIAFSTLANVYYDTYELNSVSEETVENFSLWSVFTDLGDINYLIYFLAELIAYSFILVSALSYIKSYVANKGTIQFKEITESTKQKILPYMGVYMAVSIIVLVGFALFIIPGLYLTTVFSVVGPLVVFENRKVIGSLEYSFTFIKGYWSMSFS